MNLSIPFTLLLLCGLASAALFDGLEDLVKGAKDYFDELNPYLAKGVDLAKSVNEFIENTIAEDCPYECPRLGHSPVPRPGHIKSSNGCGSLDVIFDDSEDSLIHMEAGFMECCHEHDLCYDTCGADKDLCDLTFKRCLYSVCKGKAETQILDKKACKIKAKLAYMSVIGVGCQSFRSAQKDACVCVKDDDAKSKDEL